MAAPEASLSTAKSILFSFSCWLRKVWTSEENSRSSTPPQLRRWVAMTTPLLSSTLRQRAPAATTAAVMRPEK